MDIYYHKGDPCSNINIRVYIGPAIRDYIKSVHGDSYRGIIYPRKCDKDGVIDFQWECETEDIIEALYSLKYDARKYWEEI